jgi:hypothetical protein
MKAREIEKQSDRRDQKPKIVGPTNGDIESDTKTQR